MQIVIEFEKENFDGVREDVYYTTHVETYTIASVAAARLSALKATPWIEVIRVSEPQAPIIEVA